MWSVGCIFAELLGRKVFLPGSCGIDQMNLIVQRLGSPSEEVISRIPNTRGIIFMRRLPRYDRKPLSHRFPDAPVEALDLLERMLRFDPKERITVEDALRHPYLATFHDPMAEPEYPRFDFSFDARLQSMADLKRAILEEIWAYREEYKPTLPSSILPSSPPMKQHEGLVARDPLYNHLNHGTSSLRMVEGNRDKERNNSKQTSPTSINSPSTTSNSGSAGSRAKYRTIAPKAVP